MKSSLPKRSACETLESRRLLCSLPLPAYLQHPDGKIPQYVAPEGGPDAETGGLVWSNRGVTSGPNDDRFDDLFGANAEAYRRIVDAALAAWRRVITNFNQQGGNDQIDVVVQMDSNGSGFGGNAGISSIIGNKPRTGGFVIGRGNDINGDGRGDGDGWYLDPVPTDHVEYMGDPRNAFAGFPTPGGPAAGKGDMFGLVVVEMAHVLGMMHGGNVLAWEQNANGYMTNTNVADVRDLPGKLWTFNGPSTRALLTTNNAGVTDTGFPIHVAFPPNTVTSGGFTYVAAADCGTAGDFLDVIYLPSDLMARMLKEVYGYTIRDPDTIETMYTLLNRSSGQLNVRGTNGNDRVDISVSGSTVNVFVDPGTDVPGTGLPTSFTTRFSTAELTSININLGDGNDTVFLDSIDLGTPITFNGGNGDDIMHVAELGRDLNTIDAAATFIGGTGGDEFVFWDTAPVINSAYTITTSSFARTAVPTMTFNSTTELLTLRGEGGNNIINVNSTAIGSDWIIDAGNGNDTLNLGNGNMSGVQGIVRFDGQGGSDTARMFDDASLVNVTYTVNNTTVFRSGGGTLTYAGTESLAVWHAHVRGHRVARRVRRRRQQRVQYRHRTREHPHDPRRRRGDGYVQHQPGGLHRRGHQR